MCLVLGSLAACRDQLESVRQSADVLVVSKSKLLEGAVRREICPALSHGQLHALLANYMPDEFDPEPLDAKILAVRGAHRYTFTHT